MGNNNNLSMIKVKTMTEWPDEDYSYPLPDVSHIPEQEAMRLRVKGMQFAVFGDRKQIEEDVMRDVEHNRFLWYHGRRLLALRKERMKPFIKELVDEVRYGPMFDGVFLYRVELGRFRCMREYFSYSFVADEDGYFSFTSARRKGCITRYA